MSPLNPLVYRHAILCPIKHQELIVCIEIIPIRLIKLEAVIGLIFKITDIYLRFHILCAFLQVSQVLPVSYISVLTKRVSVTECTVIPIFFNLYLFISYGTSATYEKRFQYVFLLLIILITAPWGHIDIFLIRISTVNRLTYIKIVRDIIQITLIITLIVIIRIIILEIRIVVNIKRRVIHKIQRHIIEIAYNVVLFVNLPILYIIIHTQLRAFLQILPIVLIIEIYPFVLSPSPYIKEYALIIRIFVIQSLVRLFFQVTFL